jgi:hypothetical protein
MRCGLAGPEKLAETCEDYRGPLLDAAVPDADLDVADAGSLDAAPDATP